MSSYICGDQTTMAAAEGVARYLGDLDSARYLCNPLRMANEAATGARYSEEYEHTPVDLGKRREYDDLEIIGSCECLAYQIDVASVFDDVSGKLRAAAEKIKRDGARAGKWRLPNKTERILFDGVYMPAVYQDYASGGTVTVYDAPRKFRGASTRAGTAPGMRGGSRPAAHAGGSTPRHAPTRVPRVGGSEGVPPPSGTSPRPETRCFRTFAGRPAHDGACAGRSTERRAAAPPSLDFLLGRLPTARIVTASTPAPRSPDFVRRARGLSGG